MRSAINRIGRNYWLVILEFSVLIASGMYTTVMDRSPGLTRDVFHYFLIRTAVPNNIILYGITQRLIFGPLPNKLVANPPLREGWRKWFFLFQVLPYSAFSIWFGCFAALHKTPEGFLYTALTLALLLCCYLRLNHDDEEEFPL